MRDLSGSAASRASGSCGVQAGEGSGGAQGGEVTCSAQAGKATGGAQVGEPAAVHRPARLRRLPSRRGQRRRAGG